MAIRLVHLLSLLLIHLIRFRVLLVAPCLVEVRLLLLFGLLAFLLQSPDDFIFDAIIGTYFAVGGLAEVVEGVVVHIINLVQVTGLKLVRIGITLRERKLVVAYSCLVHLLA